MPTVAIRRGAAALIVASALVVSLWVPAAAHARTESKGAGTPSAVAGTERVATCPFCYAASYEVKGVRATHVAKKFVRYLTTAWAKAKSYVWNESTTTHAALKIDLSVPIKAVTVAVGASYSRTSSWGVSVEIPANRKRFSKLALKSDYTNHTVRARAVYKAILRPTIYGPWRTGTLLAPQKDQYLTVSYK